MKSLSVTPLKKAFSSIDKAFLSFNIEMYSSAESVTPPHLLNIALYKYFVKYQRTFYEISQTNSGLKTILLKLLYKKVWPGICFIYRL